MIDKPVAFIQTADEGIDGAARVALTLRRLGFSLDDFVMEEYDYLPQELEDTFSKGFRAANAGVKVTVALPVEVMP